jgi:hypothetical protein
MVPVSKQDVVAHVIMWSFIAAGLIILGSIFAAALSAFLIFGL